MRKRPPRRAWFPALAGGLGIVAICAPALLRLTPVLVWNATPSAPVGLYRVAPEQPVMRGDLVLVRPPEDVARLAAERGYLPVGVPLVKRVAAVAGSRVCAVGDDIVIDGRLVAHRLGVDRKGRPLPAWTGCRTVFGDQVFLLNDSAPDSFDGRYFGPTDRRGIVGRLVPLWTR